MNPRDRIVVIGAAGTGRETLDIIESINSAGVHSFHIEGVLDDSPDPTHLRRLDVRGIAFLGTVDDWLAQNQEPRFFSIGIANSKVRALIAEKLLRAGHIPATLVHPRATLGSMVDVGEGSIVYSGVEITTNVVLGRFSIINSHATIGHDVMLQDFVSVNPAASISGEVRLASHVLVGGGSTVLQGLSVGEGSIVGARALVTKSVPGGVVVKGVPGRW